MNIFFDYGNTLIHFDPEEIVKSFGVAGEDGKTLAQIIFSRKYFDRLDEGSLSQEDFCKAVGEEVPGRLFAIAQLICNHWQYHLPVIEGMPELLEECRARGHKLYVLSNISENFADSFERIWIFRYFDGFIFSGKIKLVKPSCEIFRYALEKFGLKPEETVFIDDSPVNVEAARRCGIRSLLFDKDPEKARKFLAEPIGNEA